MRNRDELAMSVGLHILDSLDEWVKAFDGSNKLVIPIELTKEFNFAPQLSGKCMLKVTAEMPIFYRRSPETGAPEILTLVELLMSSGKIGQ